MKKLFLFLYVVFVLSSCDQQKRISRQYEKGKTPKGDILLDSLTVVGKKGALPYQPSITQTHDLVHTKLNVRFDFAKQYLYGNAYLTLHPHFKATDKLVLDAKGMEIKALSLLNADGSMSPLSYVYKDSLHIYVNLNKVYNSDENFSVFIDYISKPNEVKTSGGSLAITEDKGLYFINPTGEDPNQPTEIWTQGEVAANSCWFPTIESPMQRMTQEIYITVDSLYKTLSNGLLISSKDNKDGTRTDYWKQDKTAAPYLTMMAVGPFSITKDIWNGKEVSYYLEDKYGAYAHDIFGNTPEMLGLFSEELGVPYPWDKYSQVVVREFVSGAMENTSATIHYDQVQKTKRELIDGGQETIIAHELFHHWFGDYVTCESWSNLPLNESFATYGEYLWVDHKYGRESADLEMYENYKKYLDESEDKQVDLIRFYYEFPDDMFDRHSYEKGGVILHMLRNYLGDDVFFAGLKKYLTDNAFQSVEAHQLRIAMEKVSGEDLNWFFNQWFYNAGHPLLDVNYSYVQDTVIIDVTQKSSNSNAKLFRLPMKIDVYTKAGVERYDMLVYKGKQQFKYISKEQPLLINFDAEKKALAVITENKSIAEYIYQYQHAPLFRDRLDAINYLLSKQKDAITTPVLLDAMHDKNWYIRRKIVNNIRFDVAASVELMNTMKELAVSDPKSLIRADAIDKLGKLNNKINNPLFEQGLKDSSYRVIGASLIALAKTDSTASLAAARKFEQETNGSLVYGVSDVYSSYGGSKEQAYFENMIPRCNEYTKVQLMYHYANYLGMRDKPEFDIAIKTYENLALKTHSEYLPGAIIGALKRLQKYYDKRKVADQLATKSVGGDLKLLSEYSNKILFYDAAIKQIDKVILNIRAVHGS
jgi:aminopeptidase N